METQVELIDVSANPRILIVENDEKARDMYKLLFSKWGFEPFVVEGDGAELIGNAKKLAKIYRCHIAVIDLRLHDDHDRDDTSGIELAKDIKPALPVIISAYPDYKLVREGIKQNAIFNFVGKAEGPEKLKSVLDNAALKINANKRQLVIAPAGLASEVMQDIYPDHDHKTDDEVNDIFALLFENAQNLRVEEIKRAQEPGRTSVPRPRSKVFHIYPDDLQPEVVKIARASKSVKEVERYDKYIENRLVGAFCPRMDRNEAFWNLGGIVYPYMGARKVELFSEFFKNADVENIDYCLNQLFTQTWSGFYQRERSEKKQLVDAYNDVWDKKWYEERVKNFEVIDIKASMPSSWDNFVAPDPIAWVIDKIENSTDIPDTYLEVTHGDLHGDNMLVDEQKNIWLIDFERSGYGPILQDFTELESDIITRLAGIPDFDFLSIYQLGVWCAQSNKLNELPFFPQSASAHVVKAMQIITGMRRVASEVTGEVDARQYLWGVLLNLLFRATLLDRENNRLKVMRAMMLSSIFCHRLDSFDKENEVWPPADWPDVFGSNGGENYA